MVKRMVDITKLMSNDEWKVGEAFNFIDTTLISVSDDYTQAVKHLCDMVDITYEEEKSWHQVDYNDKMATAAYTIILMKDFTKILSNMAEYYYISKLELRQKLVWDMVSLTTGKHSIIQSMETIIDYVKPLGDAESLGKLESVLDYLLITNIELAQLGRHIGYELGKYLDSKYYTTSNDSFSVGCLTYRGHLEYSLGEYVCHAVLKGKYNEGYTIVLNKFGDDIVISFYEFKKYTNPNSMSHKDLNCSICVSDSNRKMITELIGEKINELTREKLEKAS